MFLRCLLDWENARGCLIGCWLPQRGGSLEKMAPSRTRLLQEAVQTWLSGSVGFRLCCLNMFYLPGWTTFYAQPHGA